MAFSIRLNFKLPFFSPTFLRTIRHLQSTASNHGIPGILPENHTMAWAWSPRNRLCTCLCPEAGRKTLSPDQVYLFTFSLNKQKRKIDPSNAILLVLRRSSEETPSALQCRMKGKNVAQVLKAALPMTHKSVTTFSSLRFSFSN